MKKLTCFLLAGLMALSMTGCFQATQDSRVPFYYRRAEFDYGTQDGIIAPEIHDVPGHTDDLRYLLALYLQGPSDQELVLPFPEGTLLTELLQEGQTITVTLSSTAASVEGVELSIACICLAETCFAISDAQQVRIQSIPSASGQAVDFTIPRDGILLPGYEILPENTE